MTGLEEARCNLAYLQRFEERLAADRVGAVMLHAVAEACEEALVYALAHLTEGDGQ